MLDLPRYLLGVAEIAWLAGFAILGAVALRARLLPGFAGAPAHLVTAILALALLIWTAELLGTLGLFQPVPYLMGVTVAGISAWLAVGGGRGCPSDAAASRFSPRRLRRPATDSTGEKPSKTEGHPRPPHATPRSGGQLLPVIALAIGALAMIKFGLEAKPKLSTGMTGFDSTWYHGPFAAGFFQGGNTWQLHFIAPQFLAWFYPANAELFHGMGMLAFGRDLLSPLLNLAWLAGCLVACWCIGRPYGVAPWSLALGAVALSLPVLSDQAGEARNDIVGIFFLLAAVATALNAGAARGEEGAARTGPGAGTLAVTGLAAGLAAGTKLNFLLPAAVLVAGLALTALSGTRWRALGVSTLAALAGGGYWYLRNLAHSGNPLPWFTDLGPVSLPGPEQELGGREGHSVLGYLADGAVWSDWFLPGLREGLTVPWPLVLGLALLGLVLALLAGWRRPAASGATPPPTLALAGLVGLAAALAWLVAPTSASGPEGMPRGFESGLRYLAPALVLGLSLLPAAPWLRRRLAGIVLGSRHGAGLGLREGAGHLPNGRILKMPRQLARHLSGREMPRALLALVVLLAAIALGYPVQRHYLEHRYAAPSFAAPGLNAAFAWARDVEDARIATTGTRQYPLRGTDLSNHVRFVGEPRPEGGFVAPSTCPAWRRLLNEGGYDYVVATRDRIEADKPPYPATARWTESPRATTVLRKPPTIVFQLSGPLAPSACRR